MAPSDDPFLRLLETFSGDAIRFYPGFGGLEDALSSLSFLTLCARYDITVARDETSPAVTTCFCGSIEAAVAAAEQCRVLLPLSVTRAEAVADLVRLDASLFCRDPTSMRIAELQGIPRDRRWLCRDLVYHLDPTALPLRSESGEGTLRLAIDDLVPGGGDSVVLDVSGRGGRWQSYERCLWAIEQVLVAVSPYAEVITNSSSFAILFAMLGRTAIVRQKPGGPYAAMDRLWFAAEHPNIIVEAGAEASPDEPPLLAGPDISCADRTDRQWHRGEARRKMQVVVQERDALALKLDELQQTFETAVAAAVIAAERDSQGVRLMPARLVEERIAADAHLVEERITVDARLVEERIALERDKAGAAAQQIVELQHQAAAEQREISSLQTALDAAAKAGQIAEVRCARMEALIDEGHAAKAKADHALSVTSEQLHAVLTSTSWRMTRPLRGIMRILR